MTADQNEYLAAGADQYVSLGIVVNSMAMYSSSCFPLAFLRNLFERKQSKKCWHELGHSPTPTRLNHI